MAKYTRSKRTCTQLNDRLIQTEIVLPQAESTCKAAPDLALALPDERWKEKSDAYLNYGYPLIFQDTFEQALEYFTKAYDLGKPHLAADSDDLARLYFNLARGSQGVAKFEDSVRYYVSAEEIYRAKFATAKTPAMKTKYRGKIRQMLLLEQYVAIVTRNTDRAAALELEMGKVAKMK